MAVGDDEKGLASSSGTKFPEVDQDFSAWVDSCLTKEPEEEFGSGWSYLKEALLEVDVSSPSKETGSSLSESVVNHQKTSEDSSWWSTYDVDTSNIFLPTYDESLRGIVTSDPEMDSYVPVNEDEIFKVWDLDVPAMEYDDGFVKELKKALAESCVDTMVPPESAPTVEDRVNHRESMDGLVSAIAGLSLNRESMDGLPR